MLEPNIKLLRMRIDVARCWRTEGRRSMAEKRNIDENVEKENIPPKKKRLSLSLKNRKDSGRFGNTSKDTLQPMATFTMPKNSARSSKWATKNLQDWLVDYNLRNES